MKMCGAWAVVIHEDRILPRCDIGETYKGVGLSELDIRLDARVCTRIKLAILGSSLTKGLLVQVLSKQSRNKGEV